MNKDKEPNPAAKGKSKANGMYKTIWRWHFYAGILIAPVLVLLAATGSIYLFKAEIEETIYQNYYKVSPQGEPIAAAEQVAEVNRLYPDAIVTRYRPGEDEERSSEVTILENSESSTVFINPYTGESMGTLNNDDRIMDKIEKLHGELMAGTIGDRIVELVACWTIVLMITGIYLWMPRKKKGWAGVLFPRLNKGKKILRRDLHAVPAFWITAGLLFLVLTGLPWSGFWGTNFQTIATNSGEGYPPSVWVGEKPASTVQTKDIAKVPWAAETLDVPLSNIQGLIPQSLDKIVETAEQEGIYPGYTVYIPQEKDGVYTLSIFSPKAQDEATMHIDQYTGAVLADYRYDNYGVIGKVIAWGITLHKGTQFGLPNKLISLFVCMSVIFVAASGLYLWWKRKPQKGLGAPAAPALVQKKPFLLLMIALGILFPLVGLSILFVWLIDWALIQRMPSVKKWLNA